MPCCPTIRGEVREFSSRFSHHHETRELHEQMTYFSERAGADSLIISCSSCVSW